MRVHFSIVMVIAEERYVMGGASCCRALRFASLSGILICLTAE